MSRPRLLDLFSGAGGAGMGYHQAGFDVVGVDIEPHDDYPFEFHQDDALKFLLEHHREFDVIHASPPCPRFSTITPDPEKHPDLLAPTREFLREGADRWGVLYVIENVPGAPLIDPVRLCGSSFGLQVRRHRLFESNAPIVGSDCNHARQGTPLGVYGDHGDKRGAVPRPNGTSRGRKARDVPEAQKAMGIDWMTTWKDLADAIPPAYTEYLGIQLADRLERAKKGGTDE